MGSRVYEQEIVIDLEFTPAPKTIRREGLNNEIIQIGAVRLDEQGGIVDDFACYVKPIFSESVNAYVRRLTGIRDCDISNADGFREALAKLVAWIGKNRTRMVAWSDSDRKQVVAECAFKSIAMPAQMGRWLDLQKVYPRLMKVGRTDSAMALHTAADWYGAGLEAGSAHSALYDAQITAELMRQLMTGEYAQQRQALAAAMPQRREDKEIGFGNTLGNLCTGLADLYQMLSAESATPAPAAA